jgi:hypothetical protein
MGPLSEGHVLGFAKSQTFKRASFNSFKILTLKHIIQNKVSDVSDPAAWVPKFCNSTLTLSEFVEADTLVGESPKRRTCSPAPRVF